VEWPGQSLTGFYGTVFSTKRSLPAKLAEGCKMNKPQRPEQRMQSIICNRKLLGIAGNDLTILLYLVILSNSRIIIGLTPAQLSENLGFHFKATYRSLAKLRKLNYIRKVKYKDMVGFMVDPTFTVTPSPQRRTFKYKLWIEAGEQGR
jgi:hypothetical protein